jgi:hypothetical protein
MLLSAKDIASYGKIPDPVIDMLIDMQRQIEETRDVRTATIAAAASTVVVTDSRIVVGSKIFLQIANVDATLKSVVYTAANGSFTITGNAAATGIVTVHYVLP